MKRFMFRKVFFLFLFFAAVLSDVAAKPQIKSLIVRNCTNSLIRKVYIMEDGKTPEGQIVHLENQNNVYKLLRKIQKKNSDQGFEEAGETDYELKVDLKIDTAYIIALEADNGDLFAIEGIVVRENTKDETLLEFNKNCRVEKNYIDLYQKNIEQKKTVEYEKLRLNFPYYFVFMMIGLIFVILGTLFAADWYRFKKSGGIKENFFHKLLGNVSSSGERKMRIVELSGILIMLIPVGLSFFTYQTDITKTYFMIFEHKINKSINIQPSFITMLAALFFYMSYILRYNFFKIENIEQIFISLFQMILDTWAIAGICSFFAGNTVWNVPLINVNSQTFIILMIVFSLIGARALAGFSWIIMIIVGIGHMTEINNAMGIFGAIYILSFSVSLGMQMSCNFSNFWEDLRKDLCGKAVSLGDNARRSINEAGKVVKKAVAVGAGIATGGSASALIGAEDQISIPEDEGQK